MSRTIYFGLAMLITVNVCWSQDAQLSKRPAQLLDSKPQRITYADADLGKRHYSNETMLAQQIAANIEKSIRQQYSPGNARRDAHPKAHGCVRAEFQIETQLHQGLAHGIFIPGKTYQAWIRFSNGAQDTELPDSKGDVRGMAIKILDVPGQKLLMNEAQSEAQANTQDFIMINHPVFFANDPQRYLSFIEQVSGTSHVINANNIVSCLSNKMRMVYIRIIK